MKKKFLDYYMQMAQLTATLSSAVRLKVGSVIVREHSVLATGYNGSPSGWDNNCEDREWMPGDAVKLSDEEIRERWPFEGVRIDDDVWSTQRYQLKTKRTTLHSEANSLMKIARSTESSEGATLFCTHAPCLDCAKLIYQAGISSVYYDHTYRDSDGLEFLEKSGVTVEQHTV